MTSGEFQQSPVDDAARNGGDAIALGRQHRDGGSPLFPQTGEPDFTYVTEYNKALLAAGVSRQELKAVTTDHDDPRRILAMNVLGGVISAKEARVSEQWDDTPTTEFSVDSIHDELNRYDESHNRARANWENLIVDITDGLRELSTSQLENIRGVVNSMNKGGY